MDDFVYDEETRNHTLNGKHIPSVSQVYEPLTDFESIPEAILARKTELGIQFHEAIRLHLLGDLHFDSLDPDIVKPMETFIGWWAEDQGGWSLADLEIEKAVYHKRLKYCGKPDLRTPRCIFDWKLRPFKPLTDLLQLEGYKHMFPPGTVVDKYVLCFDINGKMKPHRCYHPKAWGIFRKMLERYYSELEFSNLMELWKGLN